MWRIALLGAVGWAGCEPSPADFREVTCGAAPDAEMTVGATGFEPAEVAVPYAGEVRWDNTDTVERTVRSGSPGDDDAGIAFDSGPIAPGGSFCVEAREVGDQPFHEVGGAGGTLTVEAPEGGGNDTGGYGGY